MDRIPPRYALRGTDDVSRADDGSEAAFVVVRQTPSVISHRRPRIIGHRGAPALRPEHSAAGYRLAMAAEADFVEPDVVPSRDGVLVVRHEPVLDDTTDIASRPEFAARRGTAELDGARVEGWFANDLDWSEIRTLRTRERLPDLRPGSAAHDDEEHVLRLTDLVDLLREADGRTGLVIELKHPTEAAALGLDLVDALERELDGRWDTPALRGVVFESFGWDVLRRLRERGLPGRLVALVDGADGGGDAGAEGDARDLALVDGLASWADGVSVDHGRLGLDGGEVEGSRGRRLVAAAHERGLEVYTYTLRTEDQFLPDAYRGRPEAHWRAVAATGLDAVFADDPGRVRAAFDAT